MTAILQWILDFYTMIVDLVLRVSPELNDYSLIPICNFVTIIFTATFGTYIIYQLFEKVKPLRRILITTNWIFGLLSLLLLGGASFLPTVSPSFTHIRDLNVIIKPTKKQIYTNNSNVNWHFEYINYPVVNTLATDKFNNNDIRDSMDDDNLIYGELIGYKDNSKNKVDARLQKENIHIIKTENAKKYPDYVSYKITKIETKDGSLTETSYHKSRKFKFKELYLEVLADVEPNKLKDAQQDAKEHENQKDIDRLIK